MEFLRYFKKIAPISTLIALSTQPSFATVHLIFDQCGTHLTHGKLICSKNNAKLIIGSGTDSEIEIAIHNTESACRYYSGKHIRATLNLESLDLPFNAKLDESSLIRELPENSVIPPKLMKGLPCK